MRIRTLLTVFVNWWRKRTFKAVSFVFKCSYWDWKWRLFPPQLSRFAVLCHCNEKFLAKDNLNLHSKWLKNGKWDQWTFKFEPGTFDLNWTKNPKSYNISHCTHWNLINFWCVTYHSMLFRIQWYQILEFREFMKILHWSSSNILF